MSKRVNILSVTAISVVFSSFAQARPFKIAALSDPAITTQTLKSGDFEIGISDLGGGYINKLVLPGIGDVMGPVSDRYGRGGQSAMRDLLHKKYNPDQAGYDSRAGTQCQIVESPGKLTIVPRPCVRFKVATLTQLKNILPTRHHQLPADQNASHLTPEQVAKITTEFDYYGYYQNMKGTDGITIPCIKHYYEYRFIRKPGACLAEFGPGTPYYKPKEALSDLTVNHPAGVHPATQNDMSQAQSGFALRGDTVKWNAQWRYYLKKDGSWEISISTKKYNRRDKKHLSVYGPKADYQPLIILSGSNDPDKGPALGLYRPESPVNINCVVGRRNDGTQVYTDPRLTDVLVRGTPHRTEAMWLFGILTRYRGLLDRTETLPGVYETYRVELYILEGTPNQIREAAKKIDHMTAATEAATKQPSR